MLNYGGFGGDCYRHLFIRPKGIFWVVDWWCWWRIILERVSTHHQIHIWKMQNWLFVSTNTPASLVQVINGLSDCTFKVTVYSYWRSCVCLSLPASTHPPFHSSIPVFLSISLFLFLSFSLSLFRSFLIFLSLFFILCCLRPARKPMEFRLPQKFKSQC